MRYEIVIEVQAFKMMLMPRGNLSFHSLRLLPSPHAKQTQIVAIRISFLTALSIFRAPVLKSMNTRWSVESPFDH